MILVGGVFQLEERMRFNWRVHDFGGGGYISTRGRDALKLEGA